MTDDPRPTISGILGRDHRELDELWARVEATPETDRPTRQRIFAAFRTGLLAHIAEEEEHLFPKFDGTDPTLGALVDRLLDEHREIREILRGIDEAIRTGDVAIKRLGFELVDALGEHNAREENFAYPWLDGQLSPEQVEEVRRRLGSVDRSWP